jgi:putative pyruvate formate lyase activating enzyme
VFCQNWDISQSPVGAELSAERLADIMLALQERGCHNINFVTPEHVAPQVVEAIAAAVPRGLTIPIVYNTSAYDALVSLKLLDGLIDIYMPDFKFWKRETAKRLAKAPDYPARAREAIREMHRQVGPLKFGPNGLARRGVLVRHLVMPGQTDEAAAIFGWLADELSRDTYVNIMGQYRPDYEVGQLAADGSRKYADIARRPTADEIAAARAAARAAGLWRFDERWL